MLTLQSTFQYGTNHASPPMEYAELVIDYPQISVADSSTTSATPPSLLVISHGRLPFRQRLADQRYSTTLPTAGIFGEAYGVALQSYMTALLRSKPRLSLSDVTLDFQAHFSSGSDDSYLMETLFFFKNLKAPQPISMALVDGAVTHGTPQPGGSVGHAAPEVITHAEVIDHHNDLFPSLDPSTTFHHTPPPGFHPEGVLHPPPIPFPPIPFPSEGFRNNVVDANIFLVNKQAYLTMLKQLFPTLAAENESILLYMISNLVTLSETVPRLSNDSEAVQRKLIADVLTKFGLADPQGTIYPTLTQGFAKLFDIPIIIPEFKLLIVAGSLKFRNATGTIPFDDLNFYHLSTEYSVGVGEGLPEPSVSHYEWDKSTYVNNVARFRYQDPVILSRVLYPVKVRVKAYDQSDVYMAEFDPSDPKLQSLEIIVDLRLPAGVAPISGLALDQRLRGQVVALVKTCKLKGAIIVQAKKTANDSWTVVSSGSSDDAGNFALPYPSGKYSSAQATTSLDISHPAPVPINPDSTISTDFLYILLQRDEPETESSDCSCGTAAAARLPSQDDLIQSNQFTQDVGGCVSLTVPNRCLREFSYSALIRESDPDVASFTLSASEDDMYNEVYTLTPNSKIDRGLVDFANPIDWQDGDETITTSLTVYQAVTVSTGVILHYQSEFRADGYSLGDLLYSLPLAPGQKKQIVMIEASHSLVGSETQQISQADSLANNLINERAIVDQIAGNIGESLQGQSSASTSGISAGLGAAGSAGFLGASLGVSGGYSNSNSSASQEGKRGVSQYFSEILRQQVLQNASDYRNLSATAVTSVQEGQSYNAETDVIANHNHCHSMTMLYFEVLRHYAVYQDLVDAEECVFVPLHMTKFTLINLGKWADLLATRLLPLPANTWILPKTVDGRTQHSLLPAFDAAERVRTKFKTVDYPDGAYDAETINEMSGTMGLLVSLPRPKTHYDFVLSFPLTVQTEQVQVTNMKSVSDSIRDAFFSGGWSFWFGDQGSESQDVQVVKRAKILDKFIQIDEDFQTVPPAQCIRVTSFEKFSVTDNNITKKYDPMALVYLSPLDASMWDAYAKLLGFVDGASTPTQQLMEYYFLGQLISDWSSIWNQSIAPEVYKKMLAEVGLDCGDLHATTMDNYSGGSRNMMVYLSGPANQARNAIKSIRVGSKTVLANSANAGISPFAGLRNTPVLFDALGLRLNYTTPHYNGVLFSGSLNTDLLSATPSPYPAPERADEKQDPKIYDAYLANRLLQHLNSNLEYYNRVLWSGMDPNRRYMLLDGFKIETYDKYGASEGYRSLASVIKNQLTAIVGNCLVFPVAPGYKVSQALVVRRDQASEASLLDYYRPEIATTPYRISVPTRGVYAEALMGKCDSCEDVKPDSAQDWTKFTTDEPTAINAITAPVPTVSQYNPNFKDLAQPLVQVQNAPAAPDPGLGLAAVTALLGKSDIFKDVTGLDQNQKNAIEAFTKTQDNAKAFAQMASGMVTQAHNTAQSGQIMSTISSAQKSGTLSKDDAAKLVKDHIQQQIDGGATMKAQLDDAKNSKPSLTDAAVSAVKQGTTVKATKTSDSTGTVSESVDIGTGNASLSSKVQGTIEKVSQQSSKTCWAAAATMLMSWLEQRSMTQEEAMSRAGPQYREKLKANQDLKSSEKDDFLGCIGMVSEPPASYKIEAYVNWMDKYGPLWVTVDAAGDASFSPHAKVLIEIEDDTFTLFDPATSGSDPEKVKFDDFEQAFEQMATDNRGALFKQIVHFANDISKGEGYLIQGRWPVSGSPVHETMSLAALMASDFALDMSTKIGQKPDVNEFIRGTIWPDDPQNLLFYDSPTNNWSKSLGAGWGVVFDMPFNLTGGALENRSHKGDLQFLHAMSSTVGEAAQETLAKLELWAEVLYKTSIGVIKGTDRLTDLGISSGGFNMGTVFGQKVAGTVIQAGWTVTGLLTGDSGYLKLDIGRRALGTLMHTIQDSYSHSHCRRTLTNPQDIVDPTGVPPLEWKLKPGKYAEFGAVENFHCYTGQDPKRHEAYDEWPANAMNPSDVSTFNGLLGARDAIAQCTKLVNFWNRKTAWENGPQQLVKNMWALSPNATAGDTTVD